MEERDPIDDLLGALGRWAAAQRAVDAAGGRSRERTLRELAGAAATWAGVLVDLAERRAGATVAVGRDRRVGRLVGVAPDFVVLEQRSGYPALLRLDAIGAVWPDDGAGSPPGPGATPTPAGSRLAAVDLSLLGALAGLAAERAPVALVVGDDDGVTGELIAVGEDVLTLRSARPAPPPGPGDGRSHRRTVLVPVAAVLVCELR